jgi:hypothetical protein
LNTDVLFIGLIAENWNWNVSKGFLAVFDKAEISREDGNEVRTECHDVIRNSEERYRQRPQSRRSIRLGLYSRNGHQAGLHRAALNRRIAGEANSDLLVIGPTKTRSDERSKAGAYLRGC